MLFFSGEESWSSLDVLERDVLSLVNEGLLDLFEIELRELFAKDYSITASDMEKALK